MPPAARNKHSLAWLLENLHLENIFRKALTQIQNTHRTAILGPRGQKGSGVNGFEPSDCFITLLSTFGGSGFD